MKKFWHSGQLNISARDIRHAGEDDRHRTMEEDVLFAGTVNLAFLPEGRTSGRPLEAIREEVSEEWETSGEDGEQQKQRAAYHNRGFRVSPILGLTTEHEVAEIGGPGQGARNRDDAATPSAELSDDEERPARMTKSNEDDNAAGRRSEERLVKDNNMRGGKMAADKWLREGQSVMTFEEEDEEEGLTMADSGSREEQSVMTKDEKVSRVREEVRRAMAQQEQQTSRCRDPDCPYNLWLYRDQAYPTRESVLFWEERTVRRDRTGSSYKTR
jgi:hypothetical protein